MDSIIHSLLDKYNLLAFEEKFFFAGVMSLQDLAHIDHDTLRSTYLMLDADIKNFEKLRNECIIFSKSTKRTTETMKPPISYISHYESRDVSSGVGASSIFSIPLSLNCEPKGMEQQQRLPNLDKTEGIVYDVSQFPIGTVSMGQGVLTLEKFVKDEPIPIKSKISEQKTLIPKYDLDYNIFSKGLGLIMMIDKYDGGYTRPGNDDDLRKLEGLFKKMNLSVKFEDKCASPKSVLASIKHHLTTNKDLASFFIAISSIGHDGNEIFCADNQVISISDILAEISSITLPDLIGKPKIIIVESICDPSNITEKKKKKVSYQTSTKECDILVSFAYISGLMVLRDTGKHSWFITALCDAYNELIEEKTDFVNILTYANQIMLQRYYYKEEYTSKQSIQLESTLTKLLVL